MLLQVSILMLGVLAVLGGSPNTDGTVASQSSLPSKIKHALSGLIHRTQKVNKQVAEGLAELERKNSKLPQKIESVTGKTKRRFREEKQKLRNGIDKLGHSSSSSDGNMKKVKRAGNWLKHRYNQIMAGTNRQGTTQKPTQT